MSAYFHKVEAFSNDGLDLFELCEEQGLLGPTFYGAVKIYADFIAAMEGAYLYAVIQDGVVVGFTWINNMSGHAGYSHVCLFPWAQNKAALGREYMKFILGEHGFRTLVGLVPDSYKHAKDYAEAIGMTYMGVIEDAVTINGSVEDFHLYKIRSEDI